MAGRALRRLGFERAPVENDIAQRAAEWSESPGFGWPASPWVADAGKNRLRAFFEQRATGPGIWKWDHYFEIYDRHFGRFRGQPVRVLEIGVYSGGSLEMWRDYFGPQAEIYGVDIEPACRAYERDNTHILIGDQADRSFWSEVKSTIQPFDIVIDDGGHEPQQQRVSLEELLPFVRPGGVYLCEDIHEANNRFASYVHELAHRLNDTAALQESEDADRRLVTRCNPLQAAIGSISLYPFVTVLERTAAPRAELRAPKHGTQWQPFLT